MSFVNYTPSKERTDYLVAEAIRKYGEDIVIVNGEDNFNACPIFKIGFLLDKFKIEKLGVFHNQVSGISTSGCVIKKSDLEKFINSFNKRKWSIRRNFGFGQMFCTESVKIFDPAINEWKKFFEIKYGDTKYEKEPSKYCIYHCKREAICTVNNFKPCKKDVSLYFGDFKVQYYWTCVDKF
jgi:hypothetical protein